MKFPMGRELLILQTLMMLKEEGGSLKEYGVSIEY